MRRKTLLLALVAGLSALAVGSQVAGAQSVERIAIPDGARQAHSLPPKLFVGLESPATYNSRSSTGASGIWAGPRYEQVGDPSHWGFATLDWNVRFDDRAGDAEAVARANVVHRDWHRDQFGGLSVSHVVGSRSVGTVLGAYILMDQGAKFEGVLAFPLDANLHAVLHVESAEPIDDTYIVNGTTVASSWNRGQVLVAMAATELQGNLPPKIVAARGYKRGRFVRGKAVDRFLDAVVGAPVTLERFRGGTWAKVRGGKTNQRGFYSLRASRRGTYRVTVRFAGFSATSREIRAGR